MENRDIYREAETKCIGAMPIEHSAVPFYKSCHQKEYRLHDFRMGRERIRIGLTDKDESTLQDLMMMKQSEVEDRLEREKAFACDLIRYNIRNLPWYARLFKKF